MSPISKAIAGDASQPYHLVVRPHLRKQDEEYVLLMLWERKTHRLLWQYSFSTYCEFVSWSAKGRSLVVMSEMGEILFWREGIAPQLCCWNPPPDDAKDLDYYWNPILSPDSRYVLVRGGASGSKDMDAGTLLCVDLQTRRCKKLKDSVRRAEWLSPTRVRYTQVEFLMPGERLSYGECRV